jgi:hypothetical protein
MTEIPISVRPRVLVIDDWLIHDLRGENGHSAQYRAATFLTQLKRSPDRLAILLGSPWIRKAYALMKDPRPVFQVKSRQLHGEIISDSRKTIKYRFEDLQPLPAQLQEVVPPDDRFLIQLFLASEADLIVTSDKRLIEALKTIPEIRITDRETFLIAYSHPP